jgi:hypothetical protein
LCLAALLKAFPDQQTDLDRKTKERLLWLLLLLLIVIVIVTFRLEDGFFLHIGHAVDCL